MKKFFKKNSTDSFYQQAIGYLIPLMDAEYANYYTREVMLILIREFQSPDEEMKKIVLKVVKQCCATDGVEPHYIKTEILPHFFKSFWNHRMALDRRNYRQLVDTTVEIANRVGAAEIVGRVVDDLKVLIRSQKFLYPFKMSCGFFFRTKMSNTVKWLWRLLRKSWVIWGLRTLTAD